MLQHALDLKLAVASFVAVAAAVTDATAQPQGWEDVTLKGILIAALIFVGRLYLNQAKEHKDEIKQTWAAHKTEAEKREEKVVACMTKQNETLGKLCELTEEQTEHYRSFVKAAVDAKINTRP
jgi:hypothetical protein